MRLCEESLRVCVSVRLCEERVCVSVRLCEERVCASVRLCEESLRVCECAFV